MFTAASPWRVLPGVTQIDFMRNLAESDVGETAAKLQQIGDALFTNNQSTSRFALNVTEAYQETATSHLNKFIESGASGCFTLFVC